MRRPDEEVRAAIDTLERAVVHLPDGDLDGLVMAGEIAGLRYALGCETVRPSLADTLPQVRELIAEFSKAEGRRQKAEGTPEPLSSPPSPFCLPPLKVEG